MKIARLWCIMALSLVFAITAEPGSDLPPAAPISSILPTYPEAARAARVAGPVTIWFVLNAKGDVSHSGVISGNPLLRVAALTAVKSWKFGSHQRPSAARLQTEFLYTLNVQSTVGQPKLTVSMVDYRRVEVTSELYVKPIE